MGSITIFPVLAPVSPCPSSGHCKWWHSFLQRALYFQQSHQHLSSFLLFTNVASSICTPWRYPITSDDVREFKITCTNDVTMSRNECHQCKCAPTATDFNSLQFPDTLILEQIVLYLERTNY